MAREDPQRQVRRVRMSSEERHESILHSAKHVFARATYAEASTGELARASEITEPMLYKHFGSKKGLFCAVLRKFGAQFLASFQECVSERAEKDILDALEHIVPDYSATVKADPEIQRVLFQAVSEAADPEIAQCISRHNRLVYGFIHQLVERAQQEGYLDPTLSLEVATWGYMSLILAIQYGLMLDFSADIARNRDELSRIWLRGLRAPTS